MTFSDQRAGEHGNLQQLRLVGEGMHVLAELGQGHPGADRDAVAYHMEVGRGEVDHRSTRRIGDIGVSNIPLYLGRLDRRVLKL